MSRPLRGRCVPDSVVDVKDGSNAISENIKSDSKLSSPSECLIAGHHLYLCEFGRGREMMKGRALGAKSISADSSLVQCYLDHRFLGIAGDFR